jgi:hypothetical protein
MGSSSSSNADIQTLKTQVTTLQNKLSNYDAVSTAALNPSTNVTVNYDTLSNKLVTTSDNLTKIRDALINSGTKLSDAVVPAMAGNTAIQDSIRNSITQNANFANSVAGVLTSNDTYKRALKGDTGAAGSIGDFTALKSNLYGSTLAGGKAPATIWCGDGGICQVPQNVNAIDFGVGFEREGSAGKIGYGIFDGGVNGSLNIVGAGKNGQARVVRVWDALRIGDTHLRQDDDWLRLIGDKNNPGDYNKGLAAKNLWARDKVFAANRDILAELDDLKRNCVRKDRKYGIKSSRGGYLSDQGGWKGRPGSGGDWEVMYMDELPF